MRPRLTRAARVAPVERLDELLLQPLRGLVVERPPAASR